MIILFSSSAENWNKAIALEINPTQQTDNQTYLEEFDSKVITQTVCLGNNN